MRRIQIILVVLAALACAYFMPACTQVVVEDRPPSGPVYGKPGPPPWAPAHGYRAKYRYQYFAACSVYFDLGRNVYFYMSGERWVMAASLPTGICVNFDNPVVLDMETDKPYVWHSEVVKRYPPGQLKKAEGGQKGKAKGKDKWD